MIKQTPPETMSSTKRLNEVAKLLMRGVERLKERSEERVLRSYLAGLERRRKRSCSQKTNEIGKTDE